MDAKELKTSLWQRVVIIIVAILLLSSTVLTYMFIVMSSNNSKQSNEERVAALNEELTAKGQEITAAAEALSPKYYDELLSYQKQVKSYNAAKANSDKLQVQDLKEGTGKQLTEGDTDYMAYYIGWCPDGSILDASFNYEDEENKTGPKSLKSPLIQPSSLIEGWTQGVIGMKLGGVRQLSIPGEMAYGDTVGDKYCAMSNAPLKYVVMALPVDESLTDLLKEREDIYYRLYTAYMGSQG